MITKLDEFKKQYIHENLYDVNKIGTITKEVSIELELKHSVHSFDQKHRGLTHIKDSEIKEVVEAATEQIIDCLISNKLDIGDSVLITRKSDWLNVVGALSLKRGTDDVINFKVITVMRIEKFYNKHNTFQIFI
jgi:hypothetical protein